MIIPPEEKIRWTIAATLRKILRKTPLHKIKVEDIVEESGYSQQVFYRFFKDKADLVQFCFREMRDPALSALGDGEDWKATVCAKFVNMTNNKAEYQMAFEIFDKRGYFQSEIEGVVAVYKKILERHKKIKVDHDMEFLINFYVTSTLEMCAEWIINGMMESPEHLTDLLVDAMPLKLRKALELD